MSQPALQDTDYANLRGAYGYLGVKPLTTQQEMFLLNHLRGMSIAASERAAGMTKGRGYTVLSLPDIDLIRDYFRQQIMDYTMINLDVLNTMALEAHRKSVSATEELKAVEVLSKLNMVGGFAPPQVLKDRSDAAKTTEKEIGPKSAKELERMSHEDLLQLAAFDGLDSLDPEPIKREPQSEPADELDADDSIDGADDAIDAEFTTIEDE